MKRYAIKLQHPTIPNYSHEVRAWNPGEAGRIALATFAELYGTTTRILGVAVVGGAQ